MTEEQLFLAALDLADPKDRTAYLESACGGNSELRRQVEALLVAHFQSGEFLNGAAGWPTEFGIAPAIDKDAEIANSNLSAESGNGEQTRPDAPVDLQFLEPSTDSRSLGRIGHYEVLEVLGQGGFGIVLRAFDVALERVVALKVLSPALAFSSPARKRFLREARSAAQVRHENVVQVYAVGEQPLPYLVMEYIPGETLQQRLDRTGPLDVLEVIQIGRQIAEGLACAHATGLIHRDIKPANVLLEAGPQTRAKISDFGLARAADDASLTQSGVLAGTPFYMAPEQAKGDSLDHRTDLFSLGSVLYVMTAGRPPFRAATTYAVLKRVVEDEPRSIGQIIPEVPQRLSDVIGKLHAKKPEDRFQSAREVADVLADCESTRKAKANLAGSSSIQKAEPARSRGGFWKWVAAASVLLLLLIFVINEIIGTTPLSQKRPADDVQAADGDRDRVQHTPQADAEPTTEFTNTLGMKFKLIPAGQFTMGSVPEEIERAAKITGDAAWVQLRLPAEGPAHSVEITRPFFLGITEVTLGQFRQFVAANPQYIVADGRWNSPDFSPTEEHPVVWISWRNAVDFCNWLSAVEGRKYRLPTESEWEYCCRAGKSGTRYCCGDDEVLLEQYAWYRKIGGMGTKAVGTTRPNAWGLYDMHGNVWEYCQDIFDARYYDHSPVQDPPGAAEGVEGILRGGSWDSDGLLCRSAFRHRAKFEYHCDGLAGFRVLLVPPASGALK